MMRKHYLIFAVMVLLLIPLAACSGPAQTPQLPDAESVMSGKIMKIYEDSFLLAGEKAHDLYVVSAGAAPVYDENGTATDFSALEAGQTVDIGFNGLIRESFPAQIGADDYIKITAQGDDLVGLYQRVLAELWNVDQGLNSDIDLLAFDLSKLTNLSDSEKSALVWLVSGEHGLGSVTGTFEELSEQGYINKEKLFFEKGLLFEFDLAEVKDDSFMFNVRKWRGGTGAYFFQDCKAEKTTDGWQYTVGSQAIS